MYKVWLQQESFLLLIHEYDILGEAVDCSAAYSKYGITYVTDSNGRIISVHI